MPKLIRLVVVLSLIVAILPSLVTVQPAQAQSAPKIDLSACNVPLGLAAAAGIAEARCGTFSVPEDWSKPDGRKIDLAITVLPRLKAESKAPPIFHLEGGPGGSAIKGYSGVWFTAYVGLRQDHDIVLIDQRGIGKSGSLQCTEVTDQASADLTKNETPDEEASTGLARMKACLNRISAKADPAQYTSLALAQDTNAVREALGYAKINIFGSSYGTWLAQIYAGRYGATINAMVLEGTVGPWNDPFLYAGRSAEAALQRVFDTCAADAKCKELYPDLRGQLERVLVSLDKKPAQASGIDSKTLKQVPIIINRDRMLQVLQLMLYQGTLIGSIPRVISDAERGSYTMAASTLSEVAGQADSISLGLYWSVVCAENFALYDDAKIKAASDDSWFGASKPSIEQAVTMCQNWRSAELDQADVAPVKSDIPLLMLSGSFDPITPPSFSEETLARFSNATLARFPYQGHGIMPFSRCAQNLTQQFFTDPTAKPAIDCAEKDRRTLFSGTYLAPRLMPFEDAKLGRSYPMLEGWKPFNADSDAAIRFFINPDRAESGLEQYVGLGTVPGVNGVAAKLKVIQMIEAQIGPISAQAEIEQAGMLIGQYVVDMPDEVHIGALLMIPAGNGVKALWYSAPVNMFLGTYENVMTVMQFALLAG